MSPRLRSPAVGAGLLALLLAGCASVSPEGGFESVQSSVREHTGATPDWVRDDTAAQLREQRVAAWLSQPLGVDDAVQLALVNHRGLQARFHDLGITAAEVTQAGRPADLGFSFGRLRRGDEVEYERGLHLDVVRLLALPWIGRMEERRFERLKREVAMDVLSHAAATRKAYWQALAAEESARYARQVMEAAEAGAELARRMEQAGNFNKLARAREQAFYADAALGVARAERQRDASRERLVRLLGLWGDDASRLRLPERLPDLPAQPREQPDIERLAVERRLDLQAARLGAEQTARNLGLTQATRVVDVLELGLVRNGSNEAPTQRGWEIGLRLPLFDFGSARTARAEAVYRQALERAAQAAIDARSEVREAYSNYRHAWDIARHQRDEIVPLRQRIADEQLLRYNGMLIGVFELLAETRAQIASVNAAIDGLRDFWLAQADLDLALIGKPALSAPAAEASPSAAAADAGGGH